MELDQPNVGMLKGDTGHLTTADLLDMKNRLDDELQALLIARSAARQDSGPGDVEELQKRVQDLQEQLLEESNTHSFNELFVKRIQKGEALCDVIFNDTENSENNLYIKRRLEDLELISQIKKIQKETFELQEKLESRKLVNLQLKKENMEMMQRLKSNREKVQTISAEVAHNKDYKRLKSELEVKSMSLDIHKNLVQLLITGMGQDFSLNPEYSRIMLECGEPLNL